MELFDILILILVLAVVVLLALIFTNLTALKKTMDERSSSAQMQSIAPGGGGQRGYGTSGVGLGGSESGGGSGGALGGGTPAGAGAATGASGAGGGYGQPSSGETGGYGDGGAYAGGGYGSGGYGGTGAGGSGGSTQELGQASEYASWSEEGSQQPAVSTPNLDDLPEEQPFERDGRWWFKRGDELMIYDEQSGQWSTAPEGSFPGGGTASSQPAAQGGLEAQGQPSGAQQGGAQQGGVQQGGAQQGGWRCPSCGAMNGSSDRSCRMCFSARP